MVILYRKPRRAKASNLWKPCSIHDEEITSVIKAVCTSWNSSGFLWMEDNSAMLSFSPLIDVRKSFSVAFCSGGGMEWTPRVTQVAGGRGKVGQEGPPILYAQAPWPCREGKVIKRGLVCWIGLKPLDVRGMGQGWEWGEGKSCVQWKCQSSLEVAKHFVCVCVCV